MIRIILLLSIALFFTNCSTKKLSPVNVSDYFWAAQQKTNLEDAKKFVREKDKKNVALQKNIKVKRFIFSEAKIDGDNATVPTKIYLEGIFSKKTKDQIEIDFDTKLEKTSDGWKVNLVQTKQELYIQTAKKFSKGLGVEIFSKIQESLGDLRALQGAFEEIVDSMKKSLEKK